MSGHNPSGEVKEGILVEGDIILPRNTDEEHLHHPLLWENAQVHYEMDNSKFTLTFCIFTLQYTFLTFALQ